MALNLNKNGDEPKKFNLAKSDAAPSPPTNNSANDTKPGKEKKSKAWLLLLLLLGACLGLWYFTSTNAASKTEPEANVSNTGITNTAGTNPASENSATASPSTSPNVASNTSDNPTTNTGTENTKPSSENNTDKTDDKVASNNSPVNNPSSSENTKTTNNKPGSKSHIKVVAYFNAGSSNISSKEDVEVNELLDFLKKNPSETVTINGYASGEGDLTANQQLSQKRAEAFKKFLVKRGVSIKRITSNGKGIEDPIASNETSDGRSKNRRVEVIR